MVKDSLRIPDAPPPFYGPFEVSGWELELHEKGGYQFILALGMSYEFYELRLWDQRPDAWELWLVDSAVVFVESEMVLQVNRFECLPLEWDPPNLFHLLTGPPAPPEGLSVKKMSFTAQTDPFTFALCLHLNTGQGHLELTEKGGWNWHKGGRTIREGVSFYLEE